MARIRAVLFDFAGTLFAPLAAPDWVAAAAARAGLDLAPARLAELAARYLETGLPGGPYPATVPSHVERAYAERDLAPENHRRAYVGLLRTVPEPLPGFTEAVYEQVLDPSGWVPYPDARPVLDALAARGLRTGVISNIGFDMRPILRRHGFADLAERCTLSYEHGATKPRPALFRAALRTLGTVPRETLMVGDHPEADGGAAALGMPTLILPMTPPGTVHGLERVLERVAAEGG